MKTILAILAIFFLLTSCEDIIEIDLDTIEPKLVIDGCINDQADQCIIKLSLTGDYFEPGIYPAVSDAQVSITDDQGNLFILEETEPGSYISSDILGIENMSYALDVLTEGESYQAEVTMPERVNIDYLSSMIPPLMFDFDEGYVVNCHFMDPAGISNYYRMKAYKISDSSEASDSQVVFNDLFQDGNPTMVMWEVEAFMPYDTVVVELQSLAKSTYAYYSTLYPITGQGIFGASNPSDPTTNVSNDALGCFGSFTISRDTIVIMPEASTSSK